jgi:hypothetical protein
MEDVLPMNTPKKTPWRLDPGQIEVIDDALAEILKRKTTAERIAMGAEANETARDILQASISSNHPDWDKARLRAEVARRMLGDAA